MPSQANHNSNRDPRAEARVIVHVINSLDGGGTERTLVALLREFDSSRFSHAVVTMRNAGPLSASLPDHVACRPLFARRRSRTSFLKLAAVIRDSNAAVIHARNTGCWFDAIFARILNPTAKLVLGFHGLEASVAFEGRRRRIARFGLWGGARFVSVSEAGRRKIRKEAGIPAERIDLLPNGVDLRRFGHAEIPTRAQTRAELRLKETDFVVGIVGSLTPVKQHATLLRAAARIAESVPNIRLLIVGDGPLQSSVAEEARALDLGDRVLFTGWRDDVPALLHCMDVYVCSSVSEGMNNALLEAMAAGLPVVATDVGDNAIILRDGKEGRIVVPASPVAMADALATLAASPDVRRQWGVAAQTRAGDFSFDRTVRAYELYYHSLLASRADGNMRRFTASQAQARGVSPVASSPGSVQATPQGLLRKERAPMV